MGECSWPLLVWRCLIPIEFCLNVLVTFLISFSLSFYIGDSGISVESLGESLMTNSKEVRAGSSVWGREMSRWGFEWSVRNHYIQELRKGATQSQTERTARFGKREPRGRSQRAEGKGLREGGQAQVLRGLQENESWEMWWVVSRGKRPPLTEHPSVPVQR